ncbi:MAG: transporter substrate-binding domain-containing protein [Acholeplasmataceae bacterium]|nr:transporter substrate-binding domain-containing protein [Acholeplasmataceae bacterium]
MKRFSLVLFVLLFGVTLFACQVEDQFNLEVETEIVVGLEAAYAPFNWATPEENEFTVAIDGQAGFYADGYDVVMAQEIADALGLTLVIKAYSWDGLIPALNAGEIDLIIAGMSPTAERALTVNFSEEYYRSEQVMVVRNDGDYANATSLIDFNGARVVAQAGTLQDDLINQITGVVHQETLNSYSDLVNALAYGTSDAFVAELPVATGIVQTNNQFTIIEFADGLGFEVSDEDIIVSVALRLEDLDLLDAVNEALSNISNLSRQQIMQDALSRQPQE